MKTLEIQRVPGPDPNYWRVWIEPGGYCVADGVSHLRARIIAWVIRRLVR